MGGEAADIVFTWVDDRFPGYRELLARHSGDPRDLNPNRTRDNLELLRFAFRAVERFAPWAGKLHLFTCRPQVPKWLRLDHPRLVLTHHDMVMSPQHLPCFNSFAIVSHLHLLPGLSERFVYFEDDMLLLRPTSLADFSRFWPNGKKSPRAEDIDPSTESPWNMALAFCNGLLNARFGVKARQQVNHVPLLMEKSRFAEMCAQFPHEIESTRASRFRAQGNIAPEYLYPHWMRELGAAEFHAPTETRRAMGYAPLGNFCPLTWWRLRQVERQRPIACTFNDDFGAKPNPRVEAMVAQRLRAWFPEPSSFERE